VAVARLYFHEKTWTEFLRLLFTREGIAIAALAGIFLLAVIAFKQPSAKSLAVFVIAVVVASHFASGVVNAPSEPHVAIASTQVSAAADIGAPMVPLSVKINWPQMNGEVGRIVDISATTSRPGWFHYTSVSTPSGSEVIQDVPLRPSALGVVSGSAIIGDARAKEGEEYAIRVFATRSALTGKAPTVPVDAIVSESVTVRRTAKGRNDD
jgi:hypothetical protein